MHRLCYHFLSHDNSISNTPPAPLIMIALPNQCLLFVCSSAFKSFPNSPGYQQYKSGTIFCFDLLLSVVFFKIVSISIHFVRNSKKMLIDWFLPNQWTNILNNIATHSAFILFVLFSSNIKYSNKLKAFVEWTCRLNLSSDKHLSWLWKAMSYIL